MRINPIKVTSVRNTYKQRQISFQKNIDELIYPFGYDLVQYGVTSDTITVEGVKNIIQKYSPKTKVDAMENLKAQDIRAPRALFDIEYKTITSLSDGEIYIQPVSKTIYLSFKDYHKSKIGSFLAEILHEATHVFQQESDDRMSYEELYELYYENSSDKDEIKNTVKIMDDIFISLENAVSRAYSLCTQNSSKRMKYRESQFREHFNLSIQDFIQSIIMLKLDKLGNQKINYNLLFDYCILRARNEEEAYRNMLDFKPKLISKSSVGLQVEMYNKIASSINEIRKDYAKA